MSASRLGKHTSSGETKLPKIPETTEDLEVVDLQPAAVPFTHASIQDSLGVPAKEDKNSLGVREKKEGKGSHTISSLKRKSSMQKAAPLIAAEIIRHKQKKYKDNEHFYTLIKNISKLDDVKEQFKDEPTIQRNFETWLEDPNNNSLSSSTATSFNYLIGRYLLDFIAKYMAAYLMRLQTPMFARLPNARRVFAVRCTCEKKQAILDNQVLLGATLLNWLTSLNPPIRQKKPFALFELFLKDLEDKKFENLIKPNKPIWVYVKPQGCCASFFKTYLCCCCSNKRNKTTTAHPKTLHAHPSTTITVAPAPLPRCAS